MSATCPEIQQIGNCFRSAKIERSETERFFAPCCTLLCKKPLRSIFALRIFAGHVGDMPLQGGINNVKSYD